MIPPHLFYQIYLSFLERNDCTPPKCGELSEYTDSAHTQVEDPSLGCMNVSNVYDRCDDVHCPTVRGINTGWSLHG